MSDDKITGMYSKHKAKVDEINDLFIKGRKITNFILISIAAVIIFEAIIMPVIFVITKSKLAENLTMYSMLFAIIWAIVAFTVIWPKGVELKKRSDYIYKTTFIPEILDDFFDDVKYYPDRGISIDKVRDANMFKCENIDTEDYLVGTYSGVSFEQSDVKSYKRAKGQDRSQDRVNFRGIFMVIDTPYTDIDSVKVFTTDILDDRIFDRKDKVMLEGVEFNKRFDVYASNPEQAYYILTPQIQEVFLKLEKEYANYVYKIAGNQPLRGIDAHFTKGKLYFGIKGSVRAFEQATFPINLEKEYEKIQRDAEIVKAIVDGLKFAR